MLSHVTLSRIGHNTYLYRRERNILEFLVLVYYLDAMLVCRLIAAVTANGGKMAIGRHGEDKPLGNYPRSQKSRH